MGSSPLTRGKRIYRRPRTRTRRLIPAHAGKTALTTSSGPSFRAHPRSRGENKCPPSDCPRCPGSSPLTRGKPGATAAGLAGGGLIPAHAGKTNPPRREGGKPQGSSPLTRGKQLHASADNHRKRLIPAHAGKTAACKVGLVDARAHPRSRGENSDNRGHSLGTSGSSPLTRGKLRQRRQGRSVHGLIPAHAGKTDGRSTEGAGRTAHPRSRGENMMCAIVGFPVAGSSPLTRGKPGPAPAAGPSVGLIPAHAGKTSDDGYGGQDARAHPRSRGENVIVKRMS